MTRPRVYNVITRLIAGGAQENTILSCQALKDRYDILLVTGPPVGKEGSLLEDARRRGVETLVVPELVRPIRPALDAVAFRKLLALFNRGRPDIVHTHSSKAGILGRAAAWAARIPRIVHTNHGLAFHSDESLPRRAVYWALERLASSVTDRIVCVGEEMRRKAIAALLGPPGLFEVIYNGYEVERFLAARGVRAKWSIPEDVPVAGVVSRMVPHKGHRFLVEACPAGIHLLFVGDGEERSSLEREAARRGLRATFTGHVPPDEVPDLLASMDVLVHPSLWEGLPRVAVQALLVGRPVVAFDADGTREVVIDGITGRLVPPKSTEGLRSAIEDILGRPDRGRSLGEAGRKRTADRFGWREAGDTLDRLYRSLLEKKQTV